MIMMMAGAMTNTGRVGERRDPVLLDEDLDHVGHDLQQAERADAVGAVAVLPQRQQAPLAPRSARRRRSAATSRMPTHDEQAMRRRSSIARVTFADVAPGGQLPGSRCSGRPAGNAGQPARQIRGIELHRQRDALRRRCAVPPRLPSASSERGGVLGMQRQIGLRRALGDGRRQALSSSEPKM